MSLYNAVILGCGRIAGGYDWPGSDVVLTHAHAISKTSEINLAGVYDINLNSAQEMARKWRSTAYETIQDLFSNVKPDIAVVAVPDELHEEMLETVLRLSPRSVVCEKPLGRNLTKLEQLIKEFEKRNIRIAVNFRRNYDERIIQLQKEIKNNTLGEFLNGVFFYSKGIRHNGSHAISLLRFLFGEIENYRILGGRMDYKEDDPSLDLQIQFRDGKHCYLLAADERAYSIFEWQFLFSKVRLIFKMDGFEICQQEVADDPIFPGYKTVGQEQCKASGLANSMSLLYRNVLGSLEKDEDLLCDARDALATQSVIEKILENYQIRTIC